MVEAVLRLEGLKKSYLQGENRLQVLHGVSLSLAPGELVALVGASGSGKTTLLQLAGGLDVPDEGAVLWGGHRIDALGDTARSARRNVFLGVVYQFHHLLPEFTALENVMLPQRIGGADEKTAQRRAMELLERLNVADRAHHLPTQLSGGQQQRVAIARALANRPRLVLADEPTGNLDPTTAEEVFGLLLALAREEGLSALIATHNHDLAARLHRRLDVVQGLVS